MSFIDEVRARRKKLADVLKDEEYSGIRKIVEELYPDTAHFIYELLQNAEDAGASTAAFALRKEGVSFVHNGRPFNDKDVEGITNIGKGGKELDDDKIGRFGIGFKAVFAYTETPRIWSPTYSFEISDLVLPDELPAMRDLGRDTRFEFPFNNPKKAPRDGYVEVEAGLIELSEATLLFLSQIDAIDYEIHGKGKGSLLRIQHSEDHVELLKETEGRPASSSHVLRFTEPVKGFPKRSIAIAFALDALPNTAAFDPKKPLAKQFTIIPARPGRVAVFFPADKESSGLRFHLHAPFVPELSRASIKDTPANAPLFKQLAGLVAASLYKVRDLGLLTGDCLGVLPNREDEIPDRYDCIREAIIDEMRENALTPTHAKSHGPAKYLLQARASLKTLLSEEDLEFLVEYDEEPPQWAIGATQRNSQVDRFLTTLDIGDWDIEQFVQLLREKASGRWRWDPRPGEGTRGPDEVFTSWLSAKPEEWHQKFYALLYRELEPEDELDRLTGLHIVRLSTGDYGVATECYFPSDGVEHDDVFPRVAKATYTSGRAKAEQKSARNLLEGIGVREVGEAEQIEAILKGRYSEEAEIPDDKTYKKDLKRFVALVEKEPECAELFDDYFIFERASADWAQPGGVYLDTPYIETGLSAYYEPLGEEAERVALAERYQEAGISLKRLAKFAEAVGAAVRLEIQETTCQANPKWDYLSSVPGERFGYSIDRDYVIPGFAAVLEAPTVEFSRLAWLALCDLPRQSNYLQACYQINRASGAHYAESQLVAQLRGSAWVPQGDAVFVRPAEASRDLLPEGFPFDTGWTWLKAIGFGEEIAEKSEEHRRRRDVALELGFEDEESLEDGRWFAQLDPDARRTLKAEFEDRAYADLPDRESPDPDRRSIRVGAHAAAGPERQTEQRSRSVSIGREAVKQDTDPYLRSQYTNSDGEMICQVCKAPMPFKLADGSYYFEAVEFLRDLEKRYHQNYLALCPNHAAMFLYANGSSELMKDMFADLTGNELEIVLAEEDTSIYFTKTHIADLKTVIEADQTAITGDDNVAPTLPPPPLGSGTDEMARGSSLEVSDEEAETLEDEERTLSQLPATAIPEAVRQHQDGDVTHQAIAYARDNGLLIEDRRGRGGRLWIVGGKEHGAALSPLGFSFVPNGSNASGYEPAWFHT